MRILVVKLSSLGDLFHALPAVHNLKRGLDAEVDWVVQEEYGRLVGCFRDVSRVIPFFRRSFFRNLRTFLAALRRDRYDYVIDLQGLLKSALAARWARGAVRVGPSFHREGARWLYSSVAGKRGPGRHAVEQNLDVVAHLGLDPVPPVFPLDFPAWDTPAGHPRVALAPLSRWPSKNWPVARFVEVARRLQQARGAALFLVGSEAERPVCAEIAGALDGCVENLAGQTSLEVMGGLLQAMDLVIANDSGPAHMAAAAGTPTLAIFGPTDPARTGPYGRGHAVVCAPLPCRPCYSRICRRPGVPCMESVTSGCVTDKALELLKDCK